MTNYYHVLGLNESATPLEIKTAFKKLALKYHPDKHPDRPEMEEKFKEINQAHQILSDPYEKARFDLKLKYRQFTNDAPGYTAPPSARTHAAYRYRRAYTANTRMDSKENLRATAYSFGIMFVLALIIMSGIWAKESYDAKQLEKHLMERRTLFMEAKTAFKKGDYHNAFHIMEGLNYFRSEEKDMKEFKDSMIGKMIEIGDHYYFDKDFNNAILHYELIQEFKPENPFFEQKKRLAEAYRFTGQFEKSIELLEDFMVNDFDLIGTIAEIAEINKEEFGDYEKSKEYYDLGHRIAKKRYTRFYGEGYPLVIKGKYLPASHYELYAGIADNYLRMGNYPMAIKAADWNKYVWPDSAEAWVISGDSYYQMGNKTAACEEYIEAMNKGWVGQRSLQCF